MNFLKRGSGSAVFAPVWEDGEGDALHGGAVPEGSHGPCPSSDLPEAPFDGVCGPHLPAPVGRGVSEAGWEVVGVVAQALDGLRVGVPPPVGEAACGGGVRGIHDVVEVAFGVLVVGPPEFVGDVPDPVGPAVPYGDVGTDGGRAAGRPSPPSTRIISRPSPVGPRRWREAAGLPFGGAFAAGGSGGDHPLARVGENLPVAKKSRTIRAFPLQNMGFSDRSGVRLMFTAGEDKPHA